MESQKQSLLRGLPWGVLMAPLALLALSAGCDRGAGIPAASGPGAAVLASVGGQVLTEADFRRRWDQNPPLADTPEARQKVLDELVIRAAWVDAARRSGLDRDPELAEEIGRLLAARLRQQRLQPQWEALRVDDDEIRSVYERHLQTRFTEPERVRVAVLWFETRGEAERVERFRPRLDSVRTRVLSQPDAFPVAEGFGPLAMTQSEHRVSRQRGGDLGWMALDDAGAASRSAWDSAVRDAARSLKVPGDLSDVVATPGGLFLVRLTERRPAAVLPLADVRGRIERELLREKRQRLEAEFERTILAEARIVRDSPALSALAGLQTSNSLARSDSPRRSGPSLSPSSESR